MSYPGQDGEETRLSALVLQALARWLKRALDAVLAAFERFGIHPDPQGIYSVQQEWTTAVEDIILPALVPSARIGWDAILPDSDSSLVSTDSYVIGALGMSRNLLVRIPDEVYNLVFAEITDGVNDGEGIPEIAARIRGVLDATGSQRWPNRAEVIAVTEVNRAANAGAFAAGLQAERDEGAPMVKQWLTSGDRRVRDVHRAVDGDRVPMGQPFRVGGSQLMFPGDPTGLPHDVINCRCSLMIRSAQR